MLLKEIQALKLKNTFTKSQRKKAVNSTAFDSIFFKEKNRIQKNKTKTGKNQNISSQIYTRKNIYTDFKIQKKTVKPKQNSYKYKAKNFKITESTQISGISSLHTQAINFSNPVYSQKEKRLKNTLKTTSFIRQYKSIRHTKNRLSEKSINVSFRKKEYKTTKNINLIKEKPKAKEMIFSLKESTFKNKITMKDLPSLLMKKDVIKAKLSSKKVNLYKEQKSFFPLKENKALLPKDRKLSKGESFSNHQFDFQSVKSIRTFLYNHVDLQMFSKQKNTSFKKDDYNVHSIKKSINSAFPFSLKKEDLKKLSLTLVPNSNEKFPTSLKNNFSFTKINLPKFFGKFSKESDLQRIQQDTKSALPPQKEDFQNYFVKQSSKNTTKNLPFTSYMEKKLIKNKSKFLKEDGLNEVIHIPRNGSFIPFHFLKEKTENLGQYQLPSYFFKVNYSKKFIKPLVLKNTDLHTTFKHISIALNKKIKTSYFDFIPKTQNIEEKQIQEEILEDTYPQIQHTAKEYKEKENVKISAKENVIPQSSNNQTVESDIFIEEQKGENPHFSYEDIKENKKPNENIYVFRYDKITIKTAISKNNLRIILSTGLNINNANNLLKDIETILQDSGFSRFQIVIKSKSKKIYHSEKTTTTSRAVVDVKV